MDLNQGLREVIVDLDRTIDQLFEMHAMLEGPRDENERMIRAAVSDVIEARLGAEFGAALERIYSDVDYAGTYHEAMLAARQAVGA